MSIIRSINSNSDFSASPFDKASNYSSSQSSDQSSHEEQLVSPSTHVHFDALTVFERAHYNRRTQVVQILPHGYHSKYEENRGRCVDMNVVAASREIYIRRRCHDKQKPIVAPEIKIRRLSTLPAKSSFISGAGQSAGKHIRFASDCHDSHDSHYAFGTTVHQLTPVKANFFANHLSARLIRAGSYEIYKWNASDTPEKKERRQWREIPSIFSSQCVAYKDATTGHWHYRRLSESEKPKRLAGIGTVTSWIKAAKLKIKGDKKVARPAPLLQRVDLD